MVFDCPWGCAEVPRGISGGPFHENAWECPLFFEKFLAALQATAQQFDRSAP